MDTLKTQRSILKTAMQACIEVLNNEPAHYRFPKEDRGLGGLIQLEADLEAILVPDLHGRFEKIEQLLSWKIKNLSVEDLLIQGHIRLIFCGDFVHAEARASERWKRSLEEFIGDYEQHQSMDQEMDENIRTWILLAQLKAKYPYQVHLLKGNHENILDRATDPNRNFRKFAFESKMATTWCQKFLGEELVTLIDQFEQSLPLIVAGKGWVASHAEPAQAYNKEQLIQGEGSVGFGLTWTRKAGAAKGSARKTMESLLGHSGTWFSGHSSIKTTYFWDKEESVVHFHNPNQFSVIYLSGDSSFDPANNVITLPEIL